MNLILKWLHFSANKHKPSIIDADEVSQIFPDVELIPDLKYSGADGAQLAADLYRPVSQSPKDTVVDFSVSDGSMGRVVDGPLSDGSMERAPQDFSGKWKLDATAFHPISGTQPITDIHPSAIPPLQKKLPVAIFIHGGGFFVGDRKVNYVYCSKLAREGYLVFSLEYRLIDKTDAIGAINDICAGFNYVYDVMEKYSGDSNQVCVIGESAGAFLALYATALFRSEKLRNILGIQEPGLRPIRPAALVCLCGMLYTTKLDMIGMLYKKAMYGRRRKDKAFMKWMNPAYSPLVSHLPPVFLTSSRGDFLRKYTLRYAKALKKQRHPARLVYFKEGKELKHAFPSLRPMLPESERVMEKMIMWFRHLSFCPKSEQMQIFHK